MKEHRKEVELHEGKKYTRSTRKQSQSEQNKSAITDYVNIENHIIDWKKATIIGRESDRTTRWIREAVKIRHEQERGGLPAVPRLQRLTTLRGYDCIDS